MPKSQPTSSPPLSRQLELWMQQGLALHQSGRAAEAESVYRQVLAHQPAHAAANHLLGLLRLQQGNAAAAAELIARAVAQRPKDPQYHCNLGVALNAAGEPERAVESLDRAIKLKRDYAEAYSNRGMALKSLGRAAEAAQSYRQAIALKPREAGFHLNLGNALADGGELHDAEASYRKALELRPDYPAALSGLALTLGRLGRADEAVAAGEAAVRARPEQAEHHRTLGRVYQNAGRLEQAAASYRTALSLDPADAESHRLLSLVVRRRVYDEEMAAMERLYDDPATPGEQRIQLGFALGKAFADIGAPDRSFAAYVEANRLKRQTLTFSLDAARSDLVGFSRPFEHLPDSIEEYGYRDSSPIFIVGLPRAGKTTVEALLDRHPGTCAAGELGLMDLLVQDLVGRYHLNDADAAIRNVPPHRFSDIGKRYADRTRSLAGDSRIVIDTMPPNFRLIGFIRLALPNARILHCHRDPLQHCVAMFQKYFAQPGYEYTYDPTELTGYLRAYQELMGQWRRLFPGYILDFDLRELHDGPVAGLRRLLGFCGLEWDDPQLTVPDSEPQLGTGGATAASPAQLDAYRSLFLPLLDEAAGPGAPSS